MAYTIRKADYFRGTVRDEPGGAFQILSALAEQGVNLIALDMVPMGPKSTQVTLFPEDTLKLTTEAANAGLLLEGPRQALLIQGDDVLGALVDVHERLAEANVNIFASTGIADGRGGYCYLLHVRPEDLDRAAQTLEL